MGLLVNGQWQDKWYDTASTKGAFIRQASTFRQTISDQPQAPFQAESGRYHLYVSYACPWAHRTLIFLSLKQLQDHIGVTVMQPEMLSHGWALSDIGDPSPVLDIHYLHQLYTTADPNYSGRVTVPVLWDKHTQTIVNNESAEIIRILNTAFNNLTGNQLDYYPAALRSEIDQMNQMIYDTINNGVYKAGFATTQSAYEQAYDALFESLDTLERHLGRHTYLIGPEITEADWRLFTTLIRFDSVYYSHFKTNLRRIEDYPNLSNYLRDLYQQPGIAETVHFDHIKTHYFYSHDSINPTRIIPSGPAIDYTRPHDRHLERQAS